MTDDIENIENIVLKIEPEIIEQASRLLSESILNGEISIDYGKQIVFEPEVYEINLGDISSIVAGLTDPLGQIRDFFRGILDWLWGAIKNALADLGAAILKKLADVAPEVAAKVADAMRIIAKGIGDSIMIVSSALSTGLTTISTGITALSTAIINLGASVSGMISMVATSLSVGISQVSYSIAQATVTLSSAFSQGIATLGAGISQAISTVATGISQAIGTLGTSLAGAISQVSTAISGAIAQISSSIATGISQIGGAISGAIAQISSSIAQGLNMLGGSLSNLILSTSTALSAAIGNISYTLSQGILQIGTSINYVFAQFSTIFVSNILILTGRVDLAINLMSNYFPALSTNIVNGFTAMSDALEKSYNNLIDALDRSYKNLSNTFREVMEDFSNAINKTMTDTINAISVGMKKMTDTISENLVNFSEALSKSSQILMDTIIQNFKKLTGSILDAYREFSSTIRQELTNFTDTVSKNLEKFSDVLRDNYQKTVDAIIKTGENVRDYIITTSQSITDTILENLDKTMNKLRETLEEWGEILKLVGKTYEGFVNALAQLPERLDPTMKKHAEYTWDEYWTKFYEEAGTDIKLVYQQIPKLFKEESPSPWDVLLKSILQLEKGRVTYMTLAPVMIPPNSVVTVSGTPLEDLKKAAKQPLFWSPLGDFIGMAVSSLTAAYETYIKPVFSELGRIIWEGLSAACQKIIEWITGAINAIWNAAKSATEAIIKTLLSGITSTAYAFGFPSITAAVVGGSPEKELIRPDDILKGLGLPEWLNVLIYPFFGTLFSTSTTSHFLGKFMFGNFYDFMSTLFKETAPVEFGKVMEKEGAINAFGNLFVVGGLFATLPLFAQIGSRAVSYMLYQLGSLLYNANLSATLSLRPFGVGASLTVDIGKLIGGAISHFGKELKEYADTLGAGLVYGLSIWLTQPITKLATFLARNVFPIEIPSVNEILEMLRRSMPHEKYQELYSWAWYFLALYGFSDRVIELMINTEEKYHITVEDRFGTKRKIPLSLAYNLPSPSDVARMVVRDIILKLEEFSKIFKARGMTEDIASLYYLLHFRYPPPERLWTFTTRGISGLLWYSPSQQELQEAYAEAKAIGAFNPIPATSLNFKSDELFGALLKYMKWHDYARFSYIDNFTSDNQIMIDTLADIPTKIDQRWMVRFALYELMSQKGISRSSPIEAFVMNLVEGSPKGQISLDLSLFCRTLQATGIHPYYVPIVAVAETINAIADERTLLRTGVLNLYKEGFITLGGVDKLFSGVITTSFKVSYFNPKTNTWVDNQYINVPLRYLPMESKLMQLRAIIDRSLDILKDIQKDVLTGYQEYIIETYDEFKSMFSGVIDNINKIYAEEYKSIVGEEPPDILKLRFVESYYKPYTDALSIWRYVHMYRRIRSWTMRWLGWMIYRIAYAVVKPEEISKIVAFLCKAAKLTDFEREFLNKVMELMMNFSLREYIPTPSQLATLAEYISIPNDVIQKVFDARGVPEDFREIWAAYIRIRPIADDAKAVITAYRRALLYSTPEKPIPSEVVDAVKNVMKAIGFTETEEYLLNLRVVLEEFIINAKEYVPTPSQLATLAEYVPVPKELIEKTMKVRKVPEDWAILWMKYIEIRPMADDIRSLATTLFRAIEYASEAKGYVSKVESLLKEIGFTDKELEIFKLRAELEELVYKSRAYIPTPITLASVAELLPEARYYFDDMVKWLRISPEWASLWAKYIDLKPILDEVKKMLSRAEDLFCSFMINEDAFMAILASVKDMFGYTDKEIEFMLYTTKLRRHQVAWKEIIGDVDRMVMLSEYSPTAREFALGTLYKMIDSLNIDDATKALLKKMWEDFIRIRPVIDEVRKYVTDLINAYVDGTITQQILESELDALKEWGLDDYEIQFYKAIATLRKARKLKIQFY